MGEPGTGWRCDEGPCASRGKVDVTNLVVGVVDDDTSPAHPLDPRTVEVTVTPLSKGTPRPQLHSKLADLKGGVVFRYEAVQVGWYRIRSFRQESPGGFVIVKEVTRTVQVVKIQRPVKPSDEHYAISVMLGKPASQENPKPMLFFQVTFLDRNQADQGIPQLLVSLRVPGKTGPVAARSGPDGTVRLVEPDVTVGQVDILSILDDRDGSPIVYDEFARPGLATDVVHVIEMPDKRKVAEKIAATHKIKRRSEWGAVPPKVARMDPDWDYTTVVIHMSGNKGKTDCKAIQHFHMTDPSYLLDDIGYHYLVHPDGTIYEGRFLAYKGSHVKLLNTGKIGICLMGDFEPQVWDPADEEPTQKQLDATAALIRTLKLHFPLRSLGGHRDYLKDRDCPGKNLYNKLDTLRADTGLSPP